MASVNAFKNIPPASNYRQMSIYINRNVIDAAIRGRRVAISESSTHRPPD